MRLKPQRRAGYPGKLGLRDLAPAERKRLDGQRLRYCELDTLAMVMVYEAL